MWLAVDPPFGDGASSQPNQKKGNYIFQAKPMKPKLRESVQPVHAHKLAECGWRWTRRLVMAPCNQTDRK
jgi:hypothetical protein